MNSYLDFFSLSAAFVGILISICSFGQLLPAIVPGMAAIVLSLIILFKSRKNRLLLFIGLMIAYAVYSIVCANYVFEIDSYFTIYANSLIALNALAGLLLFLSVIVLLYPAEIDRFSYRDKISERVEPNQLFVLMLCGVLLLICIFGFGRPDQLGEARGEPSALYEYSSILFIAAYYYSGQSKRLNGLVSLVIALFIFQNLMYGGRVIALQLFAVLFFFRLSHRMPDFLCLVLLLVGFVALVAIGSLRAEIVGSSLSDVFEAVLKVAENGFTWDTAYSSWHTTLTFYLFKDAYSPDTMFLLSRWVLSMFIGGSAVTDSNLAEITHQHYVHYYGGVLPGFADFYLGIFGVLLIAVYVSFLVRRVSRVGKVDFSGSSGVSKLCTLYFVITVPRWLLYSPSPLIRGLLLALIVFKLLELFDRNMRSDKSNKFSIQHRYVKG